MVTAFIIQLTVIVLSGGATATNGWLAEILDKFNERTLDDIWTATGTAGSSPGYWSMLIPAASALGSVLSLIIAARIAYRTMVLEKGLDILQLFRPLAFSLVLAFWYPITWSLYSLSVPFENFFRTAYELKNDDVNQLKEQRAKLAAQVSAGVVQKAAESNAAQTLVDGAMADKGQDPSGNKDITWGMGNLISSEMGDVVFNEKSVMDDESVIVTADGDTIRNNDILSMTTHAATFNFIENCILWLAEMFWMFGICSIFLIRNLYMTVLVFFGPVYMVCSLVHVWKDKWADWISRFVSVCMYGPLTYFGMIFSLYLVSFALKSDIVRMTETVASEEGLWSYIEYMSTGSFVTLGYYCIALVVGTAVIPLAVELAGMILPADVARGATHFYSGMQGKLDMAIEKTEEAAKTAVIAAATAGAGAVEEAAAEKAVEKSAEKMAEEKLKENAAENFAGQVEPTDAESFADRFWQEKMQQADHEEEDLQQAIDEMDDYIRQAEAEGGEEFVRRYHERGIENARLAAVVQGKAGEGSGDLFGDDGHKADFLEKNGMAGMYRSMTDSIAQARLKEGAGLDASAEWTEAQHWQTRMEAHAAAILDMRNGRSVLHDDDRVAMEARREADFLAACEMQPDGTGIGQDDIARMSGQNADAYARACAEGRGEDYQRILEERRLENKALMQLAENGRMGVYLFYGSRTDHAAYLKSMGLLYAYRKAEKMERLADSHRLKAARAKRKDIRKYHLRMAEVRDNAANEIGRRIAEECRDRLYARGITRNPEPDGNDKSFRSGFDRRYTSSGSGTARSMADDRMTARQQLAERGTFLDAFVRGRFGTLAGYSAWFTFLVGDERARHDLVRQLKELDGMSTDAERQAFLSGVQHKYGTPDGKVVDKGAFLTAVAEAAIKDPDIVRRVLDRFTVIQHDIDNGVDPRTDR